MAANENSLTQQKFDIQWYQWYHIQCVSGRLDHKTDFLKNVGKKLIIFHGRGRGGDGKFHANNNFCFENLPLISVLDCRPLGSEPKKYWEAVRRTLMPADKIY